MLVDNNKCFACGSENPDGLHLQFTYAPDGGKVTTTFSPPQKFQGWQDVVHGGILITLLDEIMAKAAVHQGYSVLTGEITAKFKQPAKVMQQLRCEGEVEAVKKKLLYARAAVYAGDGTVVAQATSKMFITAHREPCK